jgi:hypothetical protein
LLIPSRGCEVAFSLQRRSTVPTSPGGIQTRKVDHVEISSTLDSAGGSLSLNICSSATESVGCHIDLQWRDQTVVTEQTCGDSGMLSDSLEACETRKTCAQILLLQQMLSSRIVWKRFGIENKGSRCFMARSHRSDCFTT